MDQPYLALPSLVAFLRANGIQNVAQWDLNIEAFWYWLDRGYLDTCRQKVHERLNAFEGRFDRLTDAEHEEYNSLVKAAIPVEEVLGELENAIQYFQETRPTSMLEYQYYLQVIRCALRLVSAAHYPTELRIHDFDMRFSPQRAGDITEATVSAENPCLEFFSRMVLPRLVGAKPRLVGMSVACMSQIIPAFTLARLVRIHLPETKIVLGGQVFNRLMGNLAKIPKLFDYVDYYVSNEGETALLQLVRYLQGQAEIGSVPNLAYLDQDSGQVVIAKNVHVEDVEALPLPDFSDLDLTRYLTPIPVLPYQPVRGCYWHRCAFCNHFAIHPPSERAKEALQVVSDLAQLKDRYRCSHFTFVNEAVRPSLLEKYAEAISKEKLDLQWYVGARLESGIGRQVLASLRSAGCAKVYFGLETGSQKVLDSMRKGISLKDAERILRDCGELGLPVHLFLMLGFPTESTKDLRVSSGILHRLATLPPKKGLTYYISVYQLKPCSLVFREPRRFGISSVSSDAKYDLEYLYEFKVLEEDRPHDYMAEVAELVEKLEVARGGAAYPENVVHFLTMQTFFCQENSDATATEVKTERAGESQFSLRKGVALSEVMSYASRPEFGQVQRVPVAYDFVRDELFIFDDLVSYQVIQNLHGIFDIAVVRSAAERALGPLAGNGKAISAVTEKIMRSQLLARVQ